MLSKCRMSYDMFEKAKRSTRRRVWWCPGRSCYSIGPTGSKVWNRIVTRCRRLNTLESWLPKTRPSRYCAEVRKL